MGNKNDCANLISNIEKKVKELIDSECKIIEQLQSLNEDVLRIKIYIPDKDITIYPLWVEAYYYNENNNFTDQSCHKKQNNEFTQFKLRPHHKKAINNNDDFHSEGNRGGVDLYLGESHDKDYYLSFLIKIAFIKKGKETPNIKSQAKIMHYLYNEHFDFMNDDIKFYENELISEELKLKNKNRVGLRKEGNEYYNKLLLASFLESENKTRTYRTLLNKYHIVDEKMVIS